MTLSYVDRHGGNKQFLWGLTYTESGARCTTESWHNTVSSDDVLQMMEKVPGWGEPMKALSKACWVLQIGDAAETFLPTSGNGVTQAIEDAVTIAACLQNASRDEIATAVRTHSLLRGDRVATAQLLGFYNAERFQKTDVEAVGKDAKVSAKLPKWIYTSDPEYKAAESLREGGQPLMNTNIPEGYVPNPWTMEGIEKLYADGKHVELKGDWL
ncbi:hypothetical protein B0A55_07219 [Friedmanniomyces simplex]|uniref:Uncharacterized protein n=1 Tax=Friedmanniomyces simplex TaxID=329884 RepID=A0A4U0X7R2_9PEZI|nr:hypothetical protein B0A55_07219 [Friedmanniomyces simplex]